MTPQRDAEIVLFDSACPLCRRTVEFVRRCDHRGQLRFVELQSETGRSLLGEHGLATDRLDTVIVIVGRQVYDRSGAALHIARRLGLPGLLFHLLQLVPRRARDGAYDFVAQRRRAHVK